VAHSCAFLFFAHEWGTSTARSSTLKRKPVLRVAHSPQLPGWPIHARPCSLRMSGEPQPPAQPLSTPPLRQDATRLCPIPKEPTNFSAGPDFSQAVTAARKARVLPAGGRSAGEAATTKLPSPHRHKSQRRARTLPKPPPKNPESQRFKTSPSPLDSTKVTK